ncbi:hypothetical protein AB2L27_19865 [Kineococcus sp. LSe6-4]|uniref:Uncharacterized protein n=1 Tax=Kineococcus halophytocola TaxID=3234027 RepID=A0ABV4H895_9ACTN
MSGRDDEQREETHDGDGGQRDDKPHGLRPDLAEALRAARAALDETPADVLKSMPPSAGVTSQTLGLDIAKRLGLGSSPFQQQIDVITKSDRQ